MKVEFLNKEKNDVSFTMEFTAEEFDEATQKEYLRQKSKITVPGFRKGKAPRSIIESRYGKGVFFESAIDSMLEESYPKALDELNLDVIAQPTLEFGEEKIEQHKGFKVTVKVTVAPQPENVNYKGLEVPFQPHVMTDEDVDIEIDNLRSKNARLIDTNEVAKLGDTVVLDYAGFNGEDQFAGGTAENYELTLGSGVFIPGFEEQLVGVSAGETRDLNVTFPADYPAEELAGKDVVFQCTVHGVKREELPELDDEFAKDVSSFDTLEELKADVKKQLEEKLAQQNEYESKNAAMLALCDANPVDIPQAMIDDEVNQMYNDYVQRLVNQGISADAIKTYLGESADKIKENYKPDAVARVHSNILVKAVAAEEKIEATEEELEEEFANYAKSYGMSVEEVKKALAGSEKFLKEDVVYRKTVEFITNNAKMVAPKAAVETEEK